MHVFIYFYTVNFVVSGNAVEWYFKSVTESRHCAKPFVRLLTKHWGSVVGGSLLNAFFKIFDIFSDCFNVNTCIKFSATLEAIWESANQCTKNIVVVIHFSNFSERIHIHT
jgi:hypothetical protein